MPKNANKTHYSGSFPADFEAFALTEDPRNGGNTLHHFGATIFMSSAALLCGAHSYGLMEEFCELREQFNFAMRQLAGSKHDAERWSVAHTHGSATTAP